MRKKAKSLTYYIIILLLLNSCGTNLYGQPRKYKIDQIRITSFGELGEYRYSFSKSFLNDFKRALDYSDSASVKITRSDWNEITDKVNKVYLDSIQFYTSPTSYANIDGDWFSYIEVFKGKEKYQTPYYDSSNPNKRLIELDSVLFAIGRKYSKINWDSLYDKALQRSKETSEEPVFQLVDQMPEYKGGNDSLNNFIQNKLKEFKNEEGKAFVRMTINRSGQIEDVELLKASNESIGQTALEIIKDMPKWIPGRQNNRTVNVRIVLTIGSPIID